MNKNSMAIALIAAAALGTSASAGLTITQNASQNAYGDHLITFDEPGVPLGPTLLPTNYYQASDGMVIASGSSDGSVGDNTSFLGFPVGTGLSYFANFGAFMNFDYKVTGLDIQFLDPSGPPSFFGGGAIAIVFNNGVQVGTELSFTPAWGGVGDEWIHIEATGGDRFDDVRILGFGFTPTSYVDNISWTPAPGSLALLGFAGLGMRRRRA